MNHQDATVRRLGVFLASVGFLTVLASLLLVLFQPGFPQLMRDARLLLSQILLDHGLAARIATVLPALATIGAGVALILGGLILLLSQRVESQAAAVPAVGRTVL